jgi:hypothetical protein
MGSRRLAALVALLAGAGGCALLVVVVVNRFPRGLVVALVLGLAVAAAQAGVRRRGAARSLALVVAGILLVVDVVLVLTGELMLEGLLALALLVVAVVAARTALRVHVSRPAATPPTRPGMVWNARSGGGKAVAHHLADEARERGIEAIELAPGTDLAELVLDAVARGADALAAAGGDGTQAIVAAIAAEHDLPFACIPAGTRNHFALDLGVDREDVVGALDAFVDGSERRVDLAEVNGRVFVNNVSLGLYAEAVQREGYRDAKLRTILDTAPDMAGTDTGRAGALAWTDPAGATHRAAQVILVSNNEYRLGRVVGSGTRPRLDAGRLGVAVLLPPGGSPGGRGRHTRWMRWAAPTFEISSSGQVPVGVDGEALVMEPPLRFVSRPGVLRVRVARRHPGASPSAAQPDTVGGTIGLLADFARGRDGGERR